MPDQAAIRPRAWEHDDENEFADFYADRCRHGWIARIDVERT
jgi:hypothetical protein